MIGPKPNWKKIFTFIVIARCMSPTYMPWTQRRIAFFYTFNLILSLMELFAVGTVIIQNTPTNFNLQVVEFLASWQGRFGRCGNVTNWRERNARNFWRMWNISTWSEAFILQIFIWVDKCFQSVLFCQAEMLDACTFSAYCWCTYCTQYMGCAQWNIYL